LEGWVEPRLTDLGGLTELTQSIDLFFGPSQSGAHDLSFSGVLGNGGGGGTNIPASGSAGPPGTASTPVSSGGLGPGGVGGGGTGATGGAHGQLPFTGYSLPAVAAVGSMLSAAGVAVRRALARNRPDEG
jgi:hypothetical protein